MTKSGIYFGSKLAELDGWDKGCGEGRGLKDDPPGSWLKQPVAAGSFTTMVKIGKQQV